MTFTVPRPASVDERLLAQAASAGRRNGYVDGYHEGFIVGVAVSCLGMVIFLLLMHAVLGAPR